MQVPDGSSVAQAVKLFAPTVEPGRGAAVALGDQVVASSRWSQTAVNAGDHLELLTAVAGG
nr:sulfur carrier protein ThiS [Kineosporia babensis]